MKQKKFYSSFSTSLEQTDAEYFLNEIAKSVPFETPSSIIRVAISLALALGLDRLSVFGIFSDKTDQGVKAIVNTLKDSGLFTIQESVCTEN